MLLFQDNPTTSDFTYWSHCGWRLEPEDNFIHLYPISWEDMENLHKNQPIVGFPVVIAVNLNKKEVKVWPTPSNDIYLYELED